MRATADVAQVKQSSSTMVSWDRETAAGRRGAETPVTRKQTMKTLPALTLALIATMLGTTAYAGGLTRAQVRGETLAAIRNGDIIQGNGFPARYLYPSLYPTVPAVSHLTRGQVEAQTLAAIDNGTITNGDGLPYRYLYPALYPTAPAVSHLTRAEVKAELAQAMRTGNMPAPGRITMTVREEFHPQLYG
jgi:hypothetical protein